MHALLTGGRLAAVAMVAAAAVLAVGPASPAQAQPSCPSVAFSATTWSTGPDTGGFAAGITLTNDCRITIDGWTLRLTFAPDHALQHGWSARWSASGGDITADSLEWNSVLHTGASTTIGFIGTYSGTFQDPLTCTINGDACGGSGTNQAPEVTLTSPPERIPYGCPITLAADAIDHDGTVQLVEFYVNDQLVGSDDQAPYELEISPNHPALVEVAGVEPNTAYARAYDDHDPPHTGTSPMASFWQGPPPPPGLLLLACSFGVELEPGDSAVVGFLGGGCGVTEAFDVEVLVSGDPGITADPTSFTFGPGAWRQDVTIIAAPGSAGATATVRVQPRGAPCAPASVPVTVVGEPEQNQPPAVTLTAPTDGQVFVSPCPVRLAADAVDPDGEITRVDFYVNGRRVGGDEEAPYEIVLPGNHWSFGFGGNANFVFAEAFDDGDPPLSGASEAATFFQAVPPPALALLVCTSRVELEPGGSAEVHFANLCGEEIQVTTSITGHPGVTVEPASFALGFSGGRSVTISVEPGAAGGTATVLADGAGLSYCRATVQVTVSG